MNLLGNKSVGAFSWTGITVNVKDRQTKKSVHLISDIYGSAKKGMFEEKSSVAYTDSCR